MNNCAGYIDPDIKQAPGEAIIYTMDWPNRGLPAGAAIASQRYLPSGTTDYTISDTGITDDGLYTNFKLATNNGIPGTFYAITNEITLSDGEVMRATVIFACVLENLRQRNTMI